MSDYIAHIALAFMGTVVSLLAVCSPFLALLTLAHRYFEGRWWWQR